MITQSEAIIDAFRNLGGTRTISEINDWVNKNYETRWKDFGTTMADMVPVSLGGNNSSTVPEYFRVLERVTPGKYCLIEDIAF